MQKKEKTTISALNKDRKKAMAWVLCQVLGRNIFITGAQMVGANAGYIADGPATQHKLLQDKWVPAI